MIDKLPNRLRSIIPNLGDPRVRQNVTIYAVMGGMTLAVLGIAKGVYRLGDYLDQQYFAEPRNASIQATAVAVEAASEALKADYVRTGGVDLVRKSASYVVTPRGSARLAESEAVLIDNAWNRIKTETGCDPTQTVILPEAPGSHPWNQPIAPKAYLIGIKC